MWCVNRQTRGGREWSQWWQLSIPLLSLPYPSSRHRMTKGSPQVTEELSIHMSNKTPAHTHTHTHMEDGACFMASVGHCVTYACWSSAGRCASPAAGGVWPQSRTSHRCRCRSGWSGSGCCWARPACSVGSPSSDRAYLPGERRRNQFDMFPEEMLVRKCLFFQLQMCSRLFRWDPLCFPGSPMEQFLLRTLSPVTWRNGPLRHRRRDGSPLRCKEQSIATWIMTLSTA